MLSHTRCQVVGADEKTLKMLDKALAMDVPGARFAPHFKRGLWDGKRHMFSLARQTFAKGLQHHVERLLTELELDYEIVDLRKRVFPAPDISKIDAKMLKGVTLRPYQVAAARQALAAQTGILWLATNAGKTEVLCAIAKVLGDYRCLVLVHEKTLLAQTRERLALRLGTIEEHIGIIGDGRFDPKHITVATIQSLTRKTSLAKEAIIKQYLGTIKQLHVDEAHHCIIDEHTITVLRGDHEKVVSIKDVVIGDKVRAWSGESFVWRRVVNTFRYEAPDSLVRVEWSGGKLVCTEEHQVKMQDASKEAGELVVGDSVCAYSVPSLSERYSSKESRIQSQVLRGLPKNFEVSNSPSHDRVKKHSRLPEATLRSDVRKEKSDEALGCSSASEPESNRGRSEWQNAGIWPFVWKRKRATKERNNGGSMAGRVRVSAEFYIGNRPRTEQWLSESLQAGYSQRTNQAGSGSRRFESPVQEAFRRQEGQTFTDARLDSDESSGRVCAGELETHKVTSVERIRSEEAYVYDIEVEHDHNYVLSNGLVVSNSQAITWYKLVQNIDAQFRFMYSGTPFGSGNELMVEAVAGPVVAKIGNQELIGLGVSAVPTVEMIECSKPELPPSLTWQDIYKQGIVHNTYRNELIADSAAQFAKDKKSTLILIKELYHGDLISQQLKERGVKFEFVHGKLPMNMIEASKHRFEEGKIDVLLASTIFDEGVSVPAIRALIIGDGGKSPRSVLQKIGRGLRKKQGSNTLDVVDFVDLTHRILARHSQDRLAIFESQGFKFKGKK